MTKNKLIILQGGRLGNKMFSIANALAQAKENYYELYTEYFYELNRFLRTPIHTARDDFQTFYFDRPGYFQYTVPRRIDIRLSGYFQSEKFFKKYSDEVREFLRNAKEYDLKKEFNNILSHDHTIAIHIRRSDYMTDPGFNIIPLDYYRKAMKRVLEKLNHPEDYLFVFFSDDIEWCKVNFGQNPKYTFIDNRNKPYSDISDLYLMSYCKHTIVANSSYSWWGAWLNENFDKIVIAPNYRKIFNFKLEDKDCVDLLVDYFPEEWEQLDFVYNNEKIDASYFNIPIDGWLYLRAHEIVKYTNSLYVHDKIGLLKELPAIISYNEKNQNYDLVCTNKLDDVVINSKWTLLYTNEKVNLSNKRYLVLENPFISKFIDYRLYLIDNKPELEKALLVKCINLEVRNDRWSEFYHKEIKRQNALKYEIHDYNPNLLTKGQIGCLKSHDYVDFEAWMHNYRYCLHIEDDAILQHNIFHNINIATQELNKHDWDTCQLSAIIWNGQLVNKLSEFLYKMTGSGAHCLLVNKQAFNKSINLFGSHIRPADDLIQHLNNIVFTPFLATITDDPRSNVCEDKPEAFIMRKSIVDKFYQHNNINFVYIDSVINTPNIPFNYTKTRSIFTRKERFEQLKNSIASVRHKIPNSYIAIAECTKFNKEEYEYLTQNVERVYNYINCDEIKKDVYSMLKAEGSYALMYKTLTQINIDRFENHFKLSGRYYLNDNFDFKNYDNNLNIAKNGNRVDIFTYIYKVHKSYMRTLIKNLKDSEIVFRCAVSFEETMRNYCLLEYTELRKMGAEGIGAGGGSAEC